MKRSEQLKVLSWEHHDALKFSQNIRKALENNTDPALISQYVLFITEHHLKPHFKLEEEILLGRMSEEQQKEWSVQQVLEEHRRFQRLDERISSKKGDMIQLVTDFMTLLKSHVTLEEKWLFPYCEKVLSDEDLLQAKIELEREHESERLEWENRFWEA